jgi:ferric-dicitrate binding protein FerR (iron transport regulator)
MAYEGEHAVKTTLVEGSVKVKKGAEGVVISPGQQAQVTGNNAIRVVKDADMEEALAWKNGYFVFNGADIKSVMRQIERWYDVDVVYKGAIDEHFNGIISRNVEMSKVFKMLELTGAVHFKIENRSVTVSP